MRTVALVKDSIGRSRLRVSEDYSGLIAELLDSIFSPRYINQVDELFAPDGEGLCYVKRFDYEIGTHRVRDVEQLDDYLPMGLEDFLEEHPKEYLPECMRVEPPIDISQNEIWVITSTGFCLNAGAIIAGEELRYLIGEAKKLRIALAETASNP